MNKIRYAKVLIPIGGMYLQLELFFFNIFGGTLSFCFNKLYFTLFQVYKGRSKPTIEWHDYFANESYAERGDGVRMIWTADSLKCYHKDGTVLLTKIEEKIESFGFDAGKCMKFLLSLDVGSQI